MQAEDAHPQAQAMDPDSILKRLYLSHKMLIIFIFSY